MTPEIREILMFVLLFLLTLSINILLINRLGKDVILRFNALLDLLENYKSRIFELEKESLFDGNRINQLEIKLAEYEYKNN